MRSNTIEKTDRPSGKHDIARRWFHSQGWTPFDFQCNAWDAYLAGKSGLIHAPTGIGKTYAAWFGAILEWMTGAHTDQLREAGGPRKANASAAGKESEYEACRCEFFKLILAAYV